MEKRADIVLVERGLAATRTQAQKMIRNGQVKIRHMGIFAESSADEWQTLKKPSMKLIDEDELEVSLGAEQQYVSRAGLKLEHAMQSPALLSSSLTLANSVALDIGQSTGGFTDCLLQQGCKKVFGIDVGSSQLHRSLESDPRVESFEGINARNLSIDLFIDSGVHGFDVIVMDVSFISQTLILPQLPPLMNIGAVLISLVKPQFEVGRQGVGKGGLVKNSDSYKSVEQKITRCVKDLDLTLLDYFESAILGGDGNKEFFVVAKKQ